MIAACATVVVSAHAAEITVNDYDEVQFEGKIEKGDYEKLFTVAGDIAAVMDIILGILPTKIVFGTHWKTKIVGEANAK